jgi:hypothetical protein
VIFQERRHSGRLDLEAIEMAVRSAMHRAGATALSGLLEFPPPPADRRSIPCGCGGQAVYQELRSKPVLTPVGKIAVSRPYYLCARGLTPDITCLMVPSDRSQTEKVRIIEAEVRLLLASPELRHLPSGPYAEKIPSPAFPVV